MNFVGRQFELNYLDRQFAEPGASFCIVYGRRRIGKTRLRHAGTTTDLLGIVAL